MGLPCVILAGGLAKRMRPLTTQVPKALLRVGGRPFIDLQLEWLRSHGVRHVILSIGYLGLMIREHVGDGSRFGLRVDYADEGSTLLGTGGALRLAIDADLVGDAFLVLNGDSYLSVDIPAVEAAFQTAGLPALMTVLHNCNRWDQSNVVYRDGRIVVYDKSRPGAHAAAMEWIDYGLLVVTSNTIRAAVGPGAVADLGDVMRDLSREGRLAAFEVSERFYEIGSLEGLSALEDRLVAAEGR